MNLQAIDGDTALILAAYFGQSDVVRQLLRAGADMTLCNNKGMTALHYVKEKGHPECARALEEHAEAEAEKRAKGKKGKKKKKGGGAGAAGPSQEAEEGAEAPSAADAAEAAKKAEE